jgi:hypothetical protein
MSLFDTLKDAIFRHASSAAAPASGASSPGSAAANPARPVTNPASAPAGASGTAATTAVDLEKTLDQLNARQAQPLNWRTSIVDLMKLVGMDSSLQHRQQFAKELGYTGNTNDTAAMNTWLHSQVMAKLAQNGLKVPATSQQQSAPPQPKPATTQQRPA